MARERECHGTSSSVAQLDPFNSEKKPPPKDMPKMRSHKESLARLKEKIKNNRILKLSRTNATVTRNLATKAKTRLLNVSSRQTLLASNKALALALEAEKHKSSMAISLMNEMRHTCHVQMLKTSVLERRLKTAETSCKEAQNVVATLQDLLVHICKNNAQLLSAGLKACALMKVTPGQAKDVESEFGASSAQALPSQIVMPQRIPVGMSRNEEEVSAPEKRNECLPNSPGPVDTTARLSGLKLSFLDTTATEENERLPVALALEPTWTSYITSRRRKDLTTNPVPTIVNEETNVAAVTECKIPALEVDSFNEPVPNTSTTTEKTVYSQLDMEMTCDSSVSIEVIRTNKTENAKHPTLASVQPPPSKAEGTADCCDEQENDKENGGRSRVRSKSRKIKSAPLVTKVLQAEAANKAQCNTRNESVAPVEKTRRARNVKYKSSPIGGRGYDDRAGDDDDAFDFELKEHLYKTPFHLTSRVAVAAEEEQELVPMPSLTMPANKKCSASSTLAGASLAIPQQLIDRSNEATAVTGTPRAPYGDQLMLSGPTTAKISPMPNTERRCRSLVNYKLPNINTKLRRGDEFTDAQFLSSPIYKNEERKKKRQKRGARHIPQMSCFEEADVASVNPPASHCLKEYN
ncbi:shugoshin 1 isoform X2 [Petromyzon marinus]|uniref:shugoshin 1 isoform X2 n=1 Tax=Petromyzon marinus TaxID=7757 RepID=UPI003F6EAA14